MPSLFSRLLPPRRRKHRGPLTAPPAFAVETLSTGDKLTGGRFSGRLVFADTSALWAALRRFVEGSARGDVLDLDLTQVEAADGACMALLVAARQELAEKGVRAHFVGATGKVAHILALYHGDDRPRPRRRVKAKSALEQLGRGTVVFVTELKQVLSFLGTMLLAAIAIVRQPGTANWRATGPFLERTGADAVPIVVLINFLVGLVMAFQSSVQLKQFGANIYVADLVGLSICRELGPLMTAIILCGRSGASFAAELGSMKVGEEIDALRTMGFGVMRYLVLPRALALMIAMPLLTIIADAVALSGGLLVGILDLDLTISGYVLETRSAIHVWDVGQGLLKSLAFALAIALISCQQGLSTSGGAEGVGQRTTSSVVYGLFAIILIDAAFTVLFAAFGL